MNQCTKKMLTLSTLIVAGMHIINEYTDACISPMTSSKNEKTFSWKDLHISYSEKGNCNRPALLLVHNLSPSSSKEEWCHIDDALANHFHIFTLDLPGCGKSSKPNITYINYMYVEFLKDFIQKVIGKKTNVCASAYSSAFTFMTARIYPEIIDKMIIINPTPLEKLYAPVFKKGKYKQNILNVPVLGTFIYNCLVSKSSITDTYKYKFYYNEDNISDQVIEMAYYNAHFGHSSGKYLLGSMLANYTNINIIHALSKIENDIYLISNGSNDKKTCDDYKKYNENISSIYVSHCRLLPQLEIPETIIEKICNIFSIK